MCNEGLSIDFSINAPSGRFNFGKSILWQDSHHEHESSKQLHKEVIKRHKAEEGYKKISKSLNIPWS